MDPLKNRSLISGALTVLFFVLCIHFAKKADVGPWHIKAMELWQKEEWHKLRSLGENVHQIGKEDVEAFYLAMLASEQMQDSATRKLFASRLSNTRVLSWKIEKAISNDYRPESFRKRIALFRTRLIFAACLGLFTALILSLRRKQPLSLVPALLSSAGIIVLLL